MVPKETFLSTSNELTSTFCHCVGRDMENKQSLQNGTAPALRQFTAINQQNENQSVTKLNARQLLFLTLYNLLFKIPSKQFIALVPSTLVTELIVNCLLCGERENTIRSNLTKQASRSIKCQCCQVKRKPKHALGII